MPCTMARSSGRPRMTVFLSQWILHPKRAFVGEILHRSEEMKRIFFSMLMFVLLVETSTAQQEAQTISLAKGLQLRYAVIKSRLTEAAEKMPAAEFAFKPATDSRSFAQLLAHAANRNLLWCSALRGESDPNKNDDIQAKSERVDVPKAEIVKALAGSFEYCDQAIARETDATLAK